LGAAVIDDRGRMNMPNRHPLNHTERGNQALRAADVVLVLEPLDLFGLLYNMTDTIGRPSTPKTKEGAKILVIGTTDTQIKPNFGEYGRYVQADMGVTGDAETTLPYLVQAIEKEMSADRRSFAATRGDKLKAMAVNFAKGIDAQAALAWNASPISTARTVAEVWEQIKNDEFTMPSEANFLSEWPYRLWNMSKHYNSIGRSVGGGVGYTAPASLGAALANKEHGRITVSFNGDGDLMMSPGVLWTAAHHQIPILYVVHNNRAYHQEYMHVQRIAQRNQRGIERAHIGTTIDNPNINFSGLAKSLGVYSEGPIENPADLGPAINRALAVVRKGEPALIDVVSQPR